MIEIEICSAAESPRELREFLGASVKIDTLRVTTSYKGRSIPPSVVLHRAYFCEAEDSVWPCFFSESEAVANLLNCEAAVLNFRYLNEEDVRVQEKHEDAQLVEPRRLHEFLLGDVERLKARANCHADETPELRFSSHFASREIDLREMRKRGSVRFAVSAGAAECLLDLKLHAPQS